MRRLTVRVFHPTGCTLIASGVTSGSDHVLRSCVDPRRQWLVPAEQRGDRSYCQRCDVQRKCTVIGPRSLSTRNYCTTFSTCGTSGTKLVLATQKGLMTLSKPTPSGKQGWQLTVLTENNALTFLWTFLHVPLLLYVWSWSHGNRGHNCTSAT